MTETTIPDTQYAVQLVGPGELKLNQAKDVYRPGPTQILARVEAVGLCFSDLKLLKQFSAHPRKSEVVRGLSPQTLAEYPAYRPGTQPTVPGHEAVCRIVAVGSAVRRHKIGERVLVQADWRKVRTAETNGAFGYNFEGALQEYALFDERIVIEPDTGERYLIPAPDGLSASAVALVEPWACVENSYVNEERRTIKAGGRLAVVADAGAKIAGLAECFAREGAPAAVAACCADEAQKRALATLGAPVEFVASVNELKNESFDDVVHFGADAATIAALNDKAAVGGIVCLVLGGRKIGRAVSVGVGRVHYAATRWIGTPGGSAADAYRTIPPTGELRAGDQAIVVGAGGPMGQMHTIRILCCGADNLAVTATDMDDARLESLRAKAAPQAAARGVPLRIVNTQKTPLRETFSYFALMAPVGQLVADAIAASAPGALINIFAGIPLPTKHELDLDTYIAHGCFMFGTSGSRIEDMRIVLDKVAAGQLDTNCSVDAVSGMAGAVDGIAAVENRRMAGKILVYPALHEMPLIPLHELGKRYPSVAAKLEHGMWTAAAEKELLKTAR